MNRSIITWDSESDFLLKYRTLLNPLKRGDKDAYFQLKELRGLVFQNTVDIVNQRYYVTENGSEYAFPDDSGMISKTILYENEIHLQDVTLNNESTIVGFSQVDCLQIGAWLKERGFNPAVLNMASRRNPGGDVLADGRAQEEMIFRRTNLFRSLYQFVPYAEQYDIKRSRYQYPLNINYGGIYTPDAIYFRGNEESGYTLLDCPVSLSFITVPALNQPDLTPSGMITDHHVEIIKNKIRTIFRIGLIHGHDSLVLGAFGCKAVRNPSRHVARLFHEVMDEPEFVNKYRRIEFAIPDDSNVHKSFNPKCNFRPFVEEFQISLVVEYIQIMGPEYYIKILKDLLTKGDWSNSVEFIAFNTMASNPDVVQSISVGLELTPGEIEPLFLSSEDFKCVIIQATDMMMKKYPNHKSLITPLINDLLIKLNKI